jgi:hypothetical protein
VRVEGIRVRVEDARVSVVRSVRTWLRHACGASKLESFREDKIETTYLLGTRACAWAREGAGSYTWVSRVYAGISRT